MEKLLRSCGLSDFFSKKLNLELVKDIMYIRL